MSRYLAITILIYVITSIKSVALFIIITMCTVSNPAPTLPLLDPRYFTGPKIFTMCSPGTMAEPSALCDTTSGITISW